MLALSACGGRTDIDDWDAADGSDRFDANTGGSDDGPDGGSPAVGGSSAVGGTPGTGGATPPGGADGSGGLVETGGSGGIGDTGGTGGEGGSGGLGGEGGSPPVVGDVFVDCETTIEDGDGSSWASPLEHPALAIDTREDGDVIYLKKGTCRAYHDPTEPLLSIPGGLSVTLAGGYEGNNLNDQFSHLGGTTLLSGDVRGDGGVSTDAADYNDSVLLIGTGADVLISALSIEHAYGFVEDEETGCVSVGADAIFTATLSSIRKCRGPYFTALSAAPGSQVDLRAVVVEDNDTFGAQGVVHAKGATLTIGDGSVFRYNHAIDGGAIWLQGSSLEVRDTEFVENYANSHGGAIHLSDTDSSADVRGVTFFANNAPYGGAIAKSGGTLFVEGCEFTDNQAAGYGGAIDVSAGDLTLRQSVITGGDASAGGQLSAREAGTISVQDTRFWGGSADFGGHIYAIDTEKLTISNSWFVGGTAGSAGQLGINGTPVDIHKSHFFNGTAASVGSIHAAPTSVNDSDLTITESSFVGVEAANVASVIASYPSNLSIHASTFLANGSAGVPLIATYGEGTRRIFRSVFRNNQGEGALSLISSKITLEDSYVGTHTSTISGAIRVGGGATLDAVGVTLAENTTGGDATPVITVDDGGTLALTNAVVWGSAAATNPWFSSGTVDVTRTVTTCCGPAALASFGSNTNLTSTPFVDLGTHFPFFQEPTSPCIDQGSDTGRDYSVVSSVVPYAADTPPTDPGYHFQSTIPLSRDFSVDATSATWDVSDPVTSCRLIVPSERVITPSDSSGVYDHSSSPETEFFLICDDAESDTAPIVLKVTL